MHFIERMTQKEASVQDYLAKAGNASKEYLNIFKNKLTSTVVDTVYMAENLTKTVLPGNPVTREYEVCYLGVFLFLLIYSSSICLNNNDWISKITAHVGSAGPGLLWKLYSGFKKSTKQVN